VQVAASAKEKIAKDKVVAEQLDAEKKKLTMVEVDLNASREKIAGLEAQLEAKNNAFNQVSAVLVSHQNEKADMDDKLTDSKQQIESELRGKIEQFESDLKTSRDELTGLNAQLNEKSDALHEVSSNLDASDIQKADNTDATD